MSCGFGPCGVRSIVRAFFLGRNNEEIVSEGGGIVKRRWGRFKWGICSILTLSMDNNLLYYGDNLDVLRRHIKDESVDLIYLDPPFKSNQDYNILFAERDGSRSSAQIKAFEDTWHWDQGSVTAYQEVVETGDNVSDAMRSFWVLLGKNDMMAYLSQMAIRLIELQRVLKPAGSIYLHCDPTASHYLKILLDAIFGAKNFRNEK